MTNSSAEECLRNFLQGLVRFVNFVNKAAGNAAPCSE